MNDSSTKRIDQLIRHLRTIALDLKKEGAEIPAVERNVNRILASIRMLELNVCDVADLQL